MNLLNFEDFENIVALEENIISVSVAKYKESLTICLKEITLKKSSVRRQINRIKERDTIFCIYLFIKSPQKINLCKYYTIILQKNKIF